MDTLLAARTSVRIWYNDKDVSADVAPMLSSFEYNDYSSDKIDDVQVSFVDPDGRWRHKWYPDEGARLRAEIVSQVSGVGGRVSESKLPCGSFVIDTPTYSGPPDVISLKATSASVSTSLRRTARVKQWKHSTLFGIAEHIAKERGVKIVTVGQDSPAAETLEQKDESDLKFLLRQCKREGYALKVDSNRLVICHREHLDAGPAVMTIHKSPVVSRPSSVASPEDIFGVVSYSFEDDQSGTYKACVVRYRHPHKGHMSAASFAEAMKSLDDPFASESAKKTPPVPPSLMAKYTSTSGPEDGQTLSIRAHCGSQAEAERMAKARLQAANRKRKTADITLDGDIRLVSGVVVNLSGWGVFDGRYSVDEAKHTVSGSGSYQTTIKAVRVGG